MTNVVLAGVLLAAFTPVVSRFGGLETVEKVAAGLVLLPVLLVVLLCLVSAVRPGALGRAARRARARRQARAVDGA